jgi:ComF family protein
MNTLLSKLPFWRETLRETFFPQGCCLCGKYVLNAATLGQNMDALYGLCRPCRESLAIPAAERGRCQVCGQPLISEQGTCLSCRNGPERSFDRLIALYPYMGKYKKILGEYKFKKRLCLGNFLVKKLWDGLEILLDKENLNEFFLVPVPPRPEKIKHSGWDQIDYLAGIFGEHIKNNKKHTIAITGLDPEIKIYLRKLLVRLPSVSQKKLNREERSQNLKGKIIVKDNPGQIPKTAVLFDDVYTTGATLDACASALKSAGAERVLGICLCYD